jgi:hypothetical protein
MHVECLTAGRCHGRYGALRLRGSSQAQSAQRGRGFTLPCLTDDLPRQRLMFLLSQSVEMIRVANRLLETGLFYFITLSCYKAPDS